MKNLSTNALGAVFMMGSMAGFVINDTLMKIVLNDLGLFQAILIRGLFATAFMVLLCWAMGSLSSASSLNENLKDKYLIWRSIGEVGGTFFFLTALFNLPIANVTAVLQILPLTITLAAALFLGETVGWRRYIAISIGFFGVLLVVKPGAEGFNIFSIYALIATGFITLRDIATRQMPQNIPSTLVSLVTSILVTLLGLIGSLFQPWAAVGSDQLIYLVSAAAILMVGYICSILAMRDGEVSFVAPFRYSILIWALLLGYFIFGDVPDWVSIVGAVLIVGSGLFSFYRERKLARKAEISLASSSASASSH
jgi:drug/metabolite transporter (DMT)-like permease